MTIVMTVIIAIATGILVLWNILDPIHAQERITTIKVILNRIIAALVYNKFFTVTIKLPFP